MSEQEWNHLPRGRRVHFTVVEYVIAVGLIAILVRVALPFIQDAVAEQEAARAYTAVDELERAARDAAAQNDLDALVDAPPGEIPPGLDNYLPADFSFSGDGWTLDWDFFEAGSDLQREMRGTHHGSVTIDFERDDVRDAFDRVARRRVVHRSTEGLTVFFPELLGGA